jgi:hypothetical protein
VNTDTENARDARRRGRDQDATSDERRDESELM